MQQFWLPNVYTLNDRTESKKDIQGFINLMNLFGRHEKNNLTIVLISLQSPFGDFNDQV